MVDGIIEANADADFCKAEAKAGYDGFGVKANADVVLAGASAGIGPLQASAKAPSANAKTGMALDYIAQCKK